LVRLASFALAAVAAVAVRTQALVVVVALAADHYDM
jgi:hypothetical protein